MISLQELSLAKRKLEKYAKEKKEEGKMKAILNALADYSVTKDILIDSDITTIIKEIKKTYAESDTGKEAKNVLVKWKKMVDAEESSAESKTTMSSSATSEGINDSEDRPSKKMKVDNDAAPSSQSDTISSDAIVGGEWDQKSFEMLSESRKKIFNRFLDIFKDGDNEISAKVIAGGIENAIKNLHDPDRDMKQYIQKTQSLIFNLKKNEKLKAKLFFGVVEPNQLVSMSSNDLATDSLADERKKQHEMSTLARRGDIYDLARQEIQKTNGLNQESEFKCRRCKGTRTSHYAMQTRSSDEPMTVFVCCLNCGCRWRE